MLSDLIRKRLTSTDKGLSFRHPFLLDSQDGPCIRRQTFSQASTCSGDHWTQFSTPLTRPEDQLDPFP